MGLYGAYGLAYGLVGRHTSPWAGMRAYRLA